MVDKVVSSALTNPATTIYSGKNDFDFLVGKDWRVKNKVLKKRLAGSDEWEEFDAVVTDTRKILNGLGTMDAFRGQRQGKYFEGLSIRIYNPNDSTWTIHWVDNVTAKLTYQVSGTFENGVGTFYGEEPFNHQNVKLRFLWSHINEYSARWEQAYWDESNNEWEVNWVMEFTAKGP